MRENQEQAGGRSGPGSACNAANRKLTDEIRPLHALSRKADSERYFASTDFEVSLQTKRLRALPKVQAFQRATFLCQLGRGVAQTYLIRRDGDVRLLLGILVAPW
jgi:hypothetical protein